MLKFLKVNFTSCPTVDDTIMSHISKFLDFLVTGTSSNLAEQHKNILGALTKTTQFTCYKQSNDKGTYFYFISLEHGLYLTHNVEKNRQSFSLGSLNNIIHLPLNSYLILNSQEKDWSGYWLITPQIAYWADTTNTVLNIPALHTNKEPIKGKDIITGEILNPPYTGNIRISLNTLEAVYSVAPNTKESVELLANSDNTFIGENFIIYDDKDIS